MITAKPLQDPKYFFNFQINTTQIRIRNALGKFLSSFRDYCVGIVYVDYTKWTFNERVCHKEHLKMPSKCRQNKLKGPSIMNFILNDAFLLISTILIDHHLAP